MQLWVKSNGTWKNVLWNAVVLQSPWEIASRSLCGYPNPWMLRFLSTFKSLSCTLCRKIIFRMLTAIILYTHHIELLGHQCIKHVSVPYVLTNFLRSGINEHWTPHDARYLVCGLGFLLPIRAQSLWTYLNKLIIIPPYTLMQDSFQLC